MFTEDQEYLISLHGQLKFDYVEGFVIVDEGLVNNWRSSFFSSHNPVKISSVSSNGSVLYCLEITKNYHDSDSETVDQVTFIINFEKEIFYFCIGEYLEGFNTMRLLGNHDGFNLVYMIESGLHSIFVVHFI